MTFFEEKKTPSKSLEVNESALDDLSELWKSFDEADGHFFTDDLSKIFPMPEIQKPPNLSLQKLIQNIAKGTTDPGVDCFDQ